MDFIVQTENKGKRLDIFLLYQLEKYSRNQVQQMIKNSNVSVNGAVNTSYNYKLHLDDKVSVVDNLIDSESSKVVGWEYALKEIYRDENLMAIDKPAGIKVHQTNEDEIETVTNAVKFLQEDRYFRLLHRLDKETSGVLLFSLKPQYTHLVSHLFTKGEIAKEYVTLVKGHFAMEYADDHTIAEHILYNPKTELMEIDPKGQFAETKIHLMNYDSEKDISLLLIKPKTGRKHQIRVHLSYLGFPIIGDTKYNGIDADRLYLHAYRLKLPPILTYNNSLVITADVPVEFLNYATKTEENDNI